MMHGSPHGLPLDPTLHSMWAERPEGMGLARLHKDRPISAPTPAVAGNDT
nr:hypothetical protein [uncultured Cupriavidus sp.]